MKFYIFASGSKGNCTLISSNGKTLIIDMGITHKNFIEKLENTPFKFDDINAYLFTHDHNDHIGGVCKKINKEYCYCALGTLDIPLKNELIHYETYEINGFKITVLPTSHDAKNPIGFVIDDGNEKLVYMTDTGYISTKNFEYMRNANHYIIESNYNYKMLMQTSRPESLKLRIVGDCGHLSNEESAATICQLIGDKTQNICLAHISQEANTKELALETYRNIFRKYDVSLENINLFTADQYETVIFGEEVVYEN